MQKEPHLPLPCQYQSFIPIFVPKLASLPWHTWLWLIVVVTPLPTQRLLFRCWREHLLAFNMGILWLRTPYLHSLGIHTFAALGGLLHLYFLLSTSWHTTNSTEVWIPWLQNPCRILHPACHKEFSRECFWKTLGWNRDTSVFPSGSLSTAWSLSQGSSSQCSTLIILFGVNLHFTS